MYTLRIVRENETSNYFLGKSYTVRNPKENELPYFKDAKTVVEFNKKGKGFESIPIFNNQDDLCGVFIVNEDGSTFERVI